MRRMKIPSRGIKNEKVNLRNKGKEQNGYGMGATTTGQGGRSRR